MTPLTLRALPARTVGTGGDLPEVAATSGTDGPADPQPSFNYEWRRLCSLLLGATSGGIWEKQCFGYAPLESLACAWETGELCWWKERWRLPEVMVPVERQIPAVPARILNPGGWRLA